MANDLYSEVENIINTMSEKIEIKVKKIKVGNINPIDGEVIYIDGLVNTDYLNRDLLKPLMRDINENIYNRNDVMSYLCEKYISISDTKVSNDSSDILDHLKGGSAIFILKGISEYTIVSISDSKERAMSEPLNETTPRGARDGFVENIKTNIALLQRRINNTNFKIESYFVGNLNKSEVCVFYIDNLVNKEALNKVKEKINNIDVKFINNIGMLEQHMEEQSYSIFPQCMILERVDFTISRILEGKMAIAIDGVPCVIIVPCILKDFLKTEDDYSGRAIVSNVIRFLRIGAIIVVLFGSSMYLALIKFSTHLIPTEFIIPIVQSRSGIALSPFLEILILEIIIEILREGALRLPFKITGTIGVIGGIIVGDTAVKSKLVSPTTLLVVSIATVCSFLITNYELGLAIRTLRFAILIATNLMGFIGIAASFILIAIYLFSLKNFGVSYVEFKGSALENFFIRPTVHKNDK